MSSNLCCRRMISLWSHWSSEERVDTTNRAERDNDAWRHSKMRSNPIYSLAATRWYLLISKTVVGPINLHIMCHIDLPLLERVLYSWDAFLLRVERHNSTRARRPVPLSTVIAVSRSFVQVDINMLYCTCRLVSHRTLDKCKYNLAKPKGRMAQERVLS